MTESEIFPGLVGSTWWVGEPGEHVESSRDGTMFTAAGLRCGPVFHDWSNQGVVHVYGDAIVPESRYDVEVVRESCSIFDPLVRSVPIEVETTRFGDVVAPFADTAAVQPDFRDIRAFVAKFLDDPGSVDAAFADIADPTPDQTVDFRDISADVISFLGDRYPYDAPTACGVLEKKYAVDFLRNAP